MFKEQEYSINKVLVEVNTKSKKVANEYKNSLETFLQQEIFPLIESYFKETISLSKNQVHLIPKLSLEINIKSSDKVFVEKKAKEKVKEEILAALSTIIENEEEVASKSILQSKEEALFYFLKEGRAAWWDHNKEETGFTKKILFEITESPKFEAQFIKAIQNANQRDRLIRQFLNEELQILFLGVSNKPLIYSKIIATITKFKFNNYEVREKIWKVFIERMLDQTLSNFSETIEERIEELKKQQEQQKNSQDLEKFILFFNKMNPSSKKEKSYSKQSDAFHNKSTVISQEVKSKEKEEEKVLDKVKSLFTERRNNFKSEDTVTSLNKEKELRKAKEKTLLKDKKSDLNQLEKGVLKDVDSNVDRITKSKSTVQEKKEDENYKKERSEVKEKEVLNSEKAARNQQVQEVLYRNSKEVSKLKNYVANNAGLILLHPFLKSLFTTCGLLNEKYQIVKPNEAVHLLHYIATKKEQQLESNLLFEKFICNIPIHQPIERSIKLSEDLKQESEEMLKAALQNWEPMKSASIDLFRNEFLQRAGKIDITKEHPHITIERKTQDILLDKLPWNYSLCKLPWMQTLLFTDW